MTKYSNGERHQAPATRCMNFFENVWRECAQIWLWRARKADRHKYVSELWRAVNFTHRIILSAGHKLKKHSCGE